MGDWICVRSARSAIVGWVKGSYPACGQPWPAGTCPPSPCCCGTGKGSAPRRCPALYPPSLQVLCQELRPGESSLLGNKSLLSGGVRAGPPPCLQLLSPAQAEPQLQCPNTGTEPRPLFLGLLSYAATADFPRPWRASDIQSPGGGGSWASRRGSCWAGEGQPSSCVTLAGQPLLSETHFLFCTVRGGSGSSDP